ncbi:MAG: 50S ribosomal protein L18 [Chloroflexota bacterium]|nr:50S ribosomal protein L18 [Chloroflexota bacterium]
MAKDSRAVVRKRRHARVRRKIHGTAARPRLNVFRSLTHIYAQVIDDDNGRTLVAASSVDREFKGKATGINKTDQAKLVGTLVAERALQQGIKQVVFDRGGYPYHGRVRALAEASREGGLDF